MKAIAAITFGLPYSVRLSIFCVLCILACLVFAFLFLYEPVKHLLYRHFTMRMYYSTIKKVVLYNDFYLINDFVNRIGDSETFHIDHVMIGNKFIYRNTNNELVAHSFCILQKIKVTNMK